MRARFIGLLLVAALCTCDTSSVSAQDSYDKFWRSYTELGFRAGDVFEAGQGNLFLPLRQTEVNMLFADLRGNWTDGRSENGNVALAFRQMLIHDWIFGIYGGYDVSHSTLGNNFQQGSIGLEMLHPDLGFRWNGYLADEDAQLLPGLNSTTLLGDQLFIQQAAERAYSGQDIEVEARLWSHLGSSHNSWTAWHFLDWELWTAIGVYNFDNDAVGFGSMTGPRARVELRMYDIPIAGPDSRLVLSGQYEDDDVRGDVQSAMLTVRIPFGRGTRHDRSRLRGPNRRMVAPIMRNTEIVSVVGRGSLEPAAFARTGQAISRVVTLDAANNATLAADVTTAAADSLVVLDGTAGTISPAGPVTLQNGQTIIGGGSSLAIVGLNTGASATFNAPGARPSINSGANTAFNLASDSSLVGLDVTNSGNTPAVSINTVDSALVEDLMINTSGTLAHGLFLNDATQFSLRDTSITTNGATSDGLRISGDSDGNSSGLAINTTGSDAEGLHIENTSFFTLQSSSIFTSGTGGSEGILASDSAQLNVGSTTIAVTEPGTTAILADPGAGGAMAVRFSGNVINSAGSGIVLGSNAFSAGSLDGSVFNNTILVPPGSDEISAIVNGGTMNLSISGNTLDPLVGTIRLNEVSGTMNITQGAPNAAEGIDSANSVPAINVIVPGGTPDFLQPAPLLPLP